jgi:hypothetical protein
VIEMKPNEAGLVIRVLYRGPTLEQANPGTKARQREAVELVREGLHRALSSLERRVDVIGTSGFEVREDTISASSGAEVA